MQEEKLRYCEVESAITAAPDIPLDLPEKKKKYLKGDQICFTE